MRAWLCYRRLQDWRRRSCERLDVEGDVEKRLVDGRRVSASPTADVRTEQTTKSPVDDPFVTCTGSAHDVKHNMKKQKKGGKQNSMDSPPSISEGAGSLGAGLGCLSAGSQLSCFTTAPGRSARRTLSSGGGLEAPFTG